MINSMKEYMKTIIETEAREVGSVVFSKKQEAALIKAATHAKAPFISLISGQSSFDESTQTWEKLYDKKTKSFQKRYCRGTRTLGLKVSLYAKDEKTAERIMSTIMSYIPRMWIYNEHRGAIHIGEQTYSDSDANAKDAYIITTLVSFEAVVTQKWEAIPTVTSIKEEYTI